MRLVRIHAPLNHELTPTLQRIEIASSLQIPSFHIVGLPSQEVSEAKERIRAAIEYSGFEFPKRKIVLNLSPAHIRKKGTGLDLAMALAVLSSSSKSKNRSSSFEKPDSLEKKTWRENAMWLHGRSLGWKEL